GPTVGVVDATGSWLFVVNRESSNLAAISATARVARPAQNQNYGGSGASYNYSYANQGELPSVHSTTPIGPGSDGVALMGDRRAAPDAAPRRPRDARDCALPLERRVPDAAGVPQPHHHLAHGRHRHRRGHRGRPQRLRRLAPGAGESVQEGRADRAAAARAAP